ncbi:UNVERIFIED_CONTAM: Histone acetyltransferase HAC5, partial [Sesamum indicum]
MKEAKKKRTIFLGEGEKSSCEHGKKVCIAKMNLSDELDLEGYVSRPYKIRAAEVIPLFQKIEGVEVCLFGMCARECIRLLEVKPVTGEPLRTFVYHEFWQVSGTTALLLLLSSLLRQNIVVAISGA